MVCSEYCNRHPKGQSGATEPTRAGPGHTGGSHHDNTQMQHEEATGLYKDAVNNQRTFISELLKDHKREMLTLGL